MYHELIPLLEHAAPFLAAALGTVNPIAGVIVSTLEHIYNAEPGNVNDLTARISSDSDSDSKLKMVDTLLSTSPKDLIGQRLPSKIDLHLVIEYPTESVNVRS